jgi:hypothetical protein
MRRTVLAIIASAIIVSSPALALTDQEKAGRIAFANEFVRELASTQKIREIWAKDNAQDHSASDSMQTSIRTSTRAILELQASNNILEGMHLDAQVDAARTTLLEINRRKIEGHKEQIASASAMIGGPKPGVDYEALIARAPQLTATNDYLDETTFDVAKVVCSSLIDLRADSQGHASHLIMDGSQQQQLIRTIGTIFKSTVKDKDRNYTTSAAWLVNDVISDHKSSDDPW